MVRSIKQIQSYMQLATRKNVACRQRGWIILSYTYNKSLQIRWELISTDAGTAYSQLPITSFGIYTFTTPPRTCYKAIVISLHIWMLLNETESQFGVAYIASYKWSDIGVCIAACMHTQKNGDFEFTNSMAVALQSNGNL